MNVLIVGGAGYVGGALTDLMLHYPQNEIRVYDSLLFEDEYRKVSPYASQHHYQVPFVFGDIRNHRRLLNHLKWADCVVWLAAIVGDGACAINPELSQEINQESVKWLSDNFNGRIIFMSTCSVYGAQDGLLNEQSPTNPLSLYAATKLQAEEYLKGKNAMIFRLGTLFGLGDNFSRIRMDLVVNIMAAKAFYEGELKVFGGEQYRPLLHVKDAAKAIWENLDTSFIGVYNLHYENYRISDLADTVVKQIPAKIEKVKTSFEDSRNYRVNSDKARTFFFKPKIGVEEGIEELHTLFKDGRIKDINNPRYNNYEYLSR